MQKRGENRAENRGIDGIFRVGKAEKTMRGWRRPWRTKLLGLPEKCRGMEVFSEFLNGVLNMIEAWLDLPFLGRLQERPYT